MGYGINLEPRQEQVLKMTPELIQAIHLLQYNTIELETYIEEELLSNPVLELSEAADEPDAEELSAEEREPVPAAEKEGREEFDWLEYIQAREIDDISYAQPGYSGGGSGWDRTTLYENNSLQDLTLGEYLLEQLGLAKGEAPDLAVAAYIIESLDTKGYMTQTAEEISRELCVPLSLVEETIACIQKFDPPGVCARDLAECLLLQMERLGMSDPIAERIVREHLTDLASNKIGVIAKAVHISTARAQEIADLIKTLEPKPGRPFGRASDTRYILPDVIVEKTPEGYQIVLNSGSSPRLYISPYYRQILKKTPRDSQIHRFLSGRLNSASWLIKSIEQRNQTIYNVVDAVVRYQQDFFERGEKWLRPLTLKKVADELDVHESTVSRAICGKYLQSPRGVFELKHFFSGGFSCEDGEEHASESIKAMIREILEGEDASSPLSDQCIVSKLAAKGIVISRRTVAKYRDIMGIPASSKRRRYK
ncbi:MAG: RNA polymerase factor sigma-54 [Clostridiales Family XIII bacterium]|nr:RNA polymerase factor sigma-54 [Clostridiales Family XIII bacterium]